MEFKVWQPLTIAEKKLKGAKGPILIACLFYSLIKLSFFLFDYLPSDVRIPSIWFYVNNTASYFIEELLLIGIFYIGIRRAYDLPISFRNMFIVLSPKKFFKVLLTFLLTMCMPILLMFLLMLTYFWLFLFLLLPISYFMMRFSFATLLVIDKNMNPIQAMHNSTMMTRGVILKLLGSLFVKLIVLFCGVLVLGIGLIWALPLTVIYTGEIYKILATRLELTQTA